MRSGGPGGHRKNYRTRREAQAEWRAGFSSTPYRARIRSASSSTHMGRVTCGMLMGANPIPRLTFRTTAAVGLRVRQRITTAHAPKKRLEVERNRIS